jgi:hypothetical protein
MDENSARTIYEQEINNQVKSLLPNGAGSMTETRFRHALDIVAHRAFTSGENYALMSLMTSDDVALQLGVSVRRIRAIAKIKHERFGIGYQVPGTSQWLFRPSEIESLRPGPVGRPKILILLFLLCFFWAYTLQLLPSILKVNL